MLFRQAAGQPQRRRAEPIVVRSLVAAACLAVLTAAAVYDPAHGVVLTLPAVLTSTMLAAALVAGSALRGITVVAGAAAAVVSVAGTALWHLSPVGDGGPWPLLETAVLMVHAFLVCRWAPRRWATATGPAVVLAEALVGLPVVARSLGAWWESVAFCAMWSVAGLVAAGAGLYVRWLEHRRVSAVRAARHVQRVQLATDLHDFVAHDVSAMLVQVQAAQVLLTSAPDETAPVLRRVEADGHRAMASMARTIRMLRELDADTPAPDTGQPGVADLPALVARFTESGTGVARLDVELRLDHALRREADTTLYRVVVEALTNVRRHAGRGAEVTVRLERAGRGVAVTVTDEAVDVRVPEPSLARHGTGLGLAGLAERVEALGGVFAAGPSAAAGWRVRAELPGDLVDEPTALAGGGR